MYVYILYKIVKVKDWNWQKFTQRKVDQIVVEERIIVFLKKKIE